MKYSLKLTPVALSDLQIGVDYYNSQQKGLGKRFAKVIDETLDGIKKMPLSASIAYDEIRYKVVDKFPYIILYKIHGNYISIVRVFNVHQQSVY